MKIVVNYLREVQELWEEEKPFEINAPENMDEAQ